MIVALIFAVAAIVLALVAVRRPALARIAWRQASGRPAQSLLVVSGLMVAAAALTASLIAIDAAQRLTSEIERLRWGATDVTVTSDRPVPIEFADLVAADVNVRGTTRGVVPQLSLAATLADATSQRTQTLARVIGYEPGRDNPLGRFTMVGGGTSQDAGLRTIVLNERAATGLGARTGDTVTITLGSNGESVSLRVQAVARMRGKAAWGFDPIAFVRLPVAQALARSPDEINLLRVVSRGNPDAAIAALNTALARDGLPSLSAVPAKRLGLASAAAQTRFVRYALVAMSAFLLIAGILLIVNLVVMLAEQRSQHLGMLRALGMRRSHLVLIGAIEGVAFSALASAVGAGIGVGFGALLAHILQAAFQRSFLPGGEALPLLAHPAARAVLVGFAGGALVALATIVLAWRRVSRLSIGAAIRGRPSATPTRRPHPGSSLAALRIAALVVALAGLTSSDTAVRAFAGVLALAIATSLLRGMLTERARLTILSLAIVGWTLVAAETSDAADPRASMRLFVVLSLVSVFSLSFLVAANMPALERLAGILGRRSAAARQTLRPVIAALGQRPLRTGLTVGLFGVVLSLVTAAAAVLATDRPSSPPDASAYQVVATTMGPNIVDLRQDREVAAVTTVPFRVYRGAVSIAGRRIPNLTITVYEATAAFSKFEITARDSSIKRDADAWQRVIYGGGSVGTFGIPGQPLVFEGSGTTVMNVGFLRPGGPISGTIVGAPQFDLIPGELGTTYLIQTRAGVDAATFVRSLEKTWLPDGLDASTARAFADRGSEDLRLFFAMIEFMTRLALGIGILALGIVALRAAVERKQMLGTLRALGYRRRTIGVALLVEAIVVSTAGMVIGAGSGLLLNRVLLRPAFAGLDVGMIGGAVAITYLAMLLVAAGPAIRAARIRPADAVRVPD